MSEDFSDLLSDLFDMDDSHDADRQTYEKAPFGYVGGKSGSLKYILPVLKPLLHDKFVDVFGGSGVVTLNVPDVELMVYNDRYSGVVDFYRVLKSNDWSKLFELLDNFTPPLSREEWIRARSEWCTETDPVVRAAKWFYTFRNSVIGKGQCFARATNSRPPITLPSSIQLFAAVHAKMRKVLIENLDFRTCIRDFDSSDAVFYCDPPYVGTDPGIYEHKFKREDLQELLKLIRNCKGTFLLSGYRDYEIDNAVKWTNRVTWNIPIAAEVQSYTEENYKLERKDVQNVDYAEEVLWIKEH